SHSLVIGGVAPRVLKTRIRQFQNQRLDVGAKFCVPFRVGEVESGVFQLNPGPHLIHREQRRSTSDGLSLLDINLLNCVAGNADQADGASVRFDRSRSPDFILGCSGCVRRNQRRRQRKQKYSNQAKVSTAKRHSSSTASSKGIPPFFGGRIMG